MPNQFALVLTHTNHISWVLSLGVCTIFMFLVTKFFSPMNLWGHPCNPYKNDLSRVLVSHCKFAWKVQISHLTNLFLAVFIFCLCGWGVCLSSHQNIRIGHLFKWCLEACIIFSFELDYLCVCLIFLFCLWLHLVSIVILMITHFLGVTTWLWLQRAQKLYLVM